MKTEDQIIEVMDAMTFDSSSTRFPAMTYEQGIEEALAWVIGDIPDGDFEFSVNK